MWSGVDSELIQEINLDIGSGTNPRGDVNVDLFLNETTMQIDSKHPTFIDAKTTPNPIKADAHYLPFKDKTFEKSYANHVLEHLENPTKALNELLRVTKIKVTIVVPHRYMKDCKRAYRLGIHKQNFNATTVKNWLNHVVNRRDYNVSISVSHAPVLTLLLVELPVKFPSEIKISIHSIKHV